MTVHTVEINMDQNCSICGKPGRAPNGFCLECTGKVMIVKHILEPDEYNGVVQLLKAGDLRISNLQRKLRIGYTRASRLMEELEKAELISPKNSVEVKSFSAAAPDEKSSKNVDWSEVPNSVVEMAQQIIRSFHHELEDARIGFLFKRSPSITNGKRTWGKALKVNPRYQIFVDLDFIIWLDQEIWEGLPDERRQALVDHELCHCDFTTGEAKLRYHDFEEFHEIVKRYGAWNHELLILQGIFPPSPQPPMPGLEPETRGKVVALDPQMMPPGG